MRDNELREALQQLLEAGLIFRRGNPPEAIYSFKHALVQDAAYGSLLTSKRKDHHRHLAEVLEEKFPDRIQTEPELAAHHYTAAGLIQPAIRYWQRAGERAAERFAHEEAVSHFARGLEVIKALADTEERAPDELGLQTGFVDSLRILGRHAEALAALESAAVVAARHSLTRALAQIHYMRGNIYFPLGNFERCRSEHERALRFARSAGSHEYEARALSGLGDADYLRGRMTKAFGYFDECVMLSERHGLDEITASNLHMRAMTRYYAHLELAASITDCRDGISRAPIVRQFRAEVSARTGLTAVLWDAGKFDAAKEQAKIGLDRARRLGARPFEPFGLIGLAKALAEEGRLEEAVTLSRDAVSISNETSETFTGPWALGNLAVLTIDPTERTRALGRGEALLEKDCVAHCWLWFYRDAMDASLNSQNWDDVDRYAAGLEQRIRAEPMVWPEHFIDRGRALSAYGRGSRDADVMRELGRLHSQATEAGMLLSARAIDRVLR